MQLCGFDAGLDKPFFLIAGTCSIEGLQMSLDVAGLLGQLGRRHRLQLSLKHHPLTISNSNENRIIFGHKIYVIASVCEAISWFEIATAISWLRDDIVKTGSPPPRG